MGGEAITARSLERRGAFLPGMEVIIVARDGPIGDGRVIMPSAAMLAEPHGERDVAVEFDDGGHAVQRWIDQKWLKHL
jgi:hypothetical protein